MTDATIIYTHTDEAPLLATYSFLPIIEAYAGAAGVDVETRDISVAARILAQFGLADDALSELDLDSRRVIQDVLLPAQRLHIQALDAMISRLARGATPPPPGRRSRPVI